MTNTMRLKARIKNIATKNHVPAQAILQNYMLERFLERITFSKFKDNFVLKGGLLITSLVGVDTRTTMDMDTTILGLPLSDETLKKILAEICGIPLDDDVTLSLDTITPIRDEDEYGGFRAALTVRYESISTPLKIDITTGDVLTPKAVRYNFHSSFDGKIIKVWAYNIETILAEKVETILRRGIFSTRPRDFYDVYILVRTKGKVLNPGTFKTALKATAEKRYSLEKLDEWESILEAIRVDVQMQQRWERYCRDNHYARDIAFGEVIDVTKAILRGDGQAHTGQ